MADVYYFPPPTAEQIAAQEMEDRRQTFEMLKANATVEQAQNVAAMSAFYPNLSPGVATAAGVAGIDPTSLAAANLAIRQTALDVEAQKSVGDAMYMPYSWIKGAIRNLFLALEMPLQEVISHPLRMAVKDYQEGRLFRAKDDPWNMENYRETGFSDFAFAAQAGLQGQKVNLGSGFFPHSDVSPATQEALDAGVPFLQAVQNPEQAKLGFPITQYGRQQREGSVEIWQPGHKFDGPRVPVSPGRLLAIQFMSPGTTAFSNISGTLDATSDIFLDPTNIALVKWAKLREASHAIIPDHIGRTAGVVGRTLDEMLTSKEGRGMLERVASLNGDDGYNTIYRWLKGTQKGMGKPVLAEHLTKAQTPAAVEEIIRRAYTQGLLAPQTLAPVSLSGQILENVGLRSFGTAGPGVGRRVGGAAFGDIGRLSGFKVGVAASLESNYLSSLSAKVGARSLSLIDMNQGAEDLRGFLKALRFDGERTGHYMRRYAQSALATPDGKAIAGRESVFRLVKDMMHEWGDGLQAKGIPKPVVKGMEAIFETDEAMRVYFQNAAGRAEWFPGALTLTLPDGTEKVLPSAQLIAEFLNQSIPLIDVSKARSAARKANLLRFRDATGLPITKVVKDWDKIGDLWLTKLADGYMTKVWKPAVLLRVAWPVRVIGEETARQAAVGYDALWTHPLQYFAWITGRKGTKDVLGNAFEESSAWRASLSRKGGGWRQRGGPRSIYSGEWKSVHRGDAEHIAGWYNELIQLATDVVAPRVAGATDDATLLGVKDAFFDKSGDLVGARFELMRDGKRWDQLYYRPEAEGYIDSINARIHMNTGGRYKMFRSTDRQWYDMYGNKLDLRNVPNADGTARILPTSEAKNIHADYDLLGQASSVGAVIDNALIDIDEALNRKFGALGTIPGGASGQDLTRAGAAQDAATAAQNRIDDAIDEIGRALESEYGAAGQDAHIALVRRAEDMKRLTEAGLIDPVDLEYFDDDIREIINNHLGVNASLRKGRSNLTDAERIHEGGHREFIPYKEMLELNEMTTKELGATFSSLGQMDKFNPAGAPVDLPDGTYLYPKAEHGGAYQPWEVRYPFAPGEAGTAYSAAVVRNGHVEGFIILGRDEATGRLNTVRLLSHAGGDKAPGDLLDMFKALTEQGDFTGEDMLKLLLTDGAGTNIPLRQFLDTAAMRDLGIDTTKLETVADVVEAIRKSGVADAFTRLHPPKGAELMTPAGARSAGVAAKSTVRRQKNLAASGMIETNHPDPRNVSNWHQHRVQYDIEQNGNQELIDAIATGNLRGHNLREIHSDKERREVMQILRDEFSEYAPEFTKVPKLDDKNLSGLYDKMIDQLMTIFMSVPTNKLSRSPVFKQAYYKRVAQLFAFLSNGDREIVLRRMGEANLDRGILRSMLSREISGDRDAILRKLDKMGGQKGYSLRGLLPEPQEAMSLAQMDDAAKAFALHETKNLLYDMTRSHNFFDMTRNLFPFGEAWLEIFEVWSKIIAEHPNVIRRMQQGINGLRSSGIIYEDPNTHEDVFNFPGSETLGRWMFNKDQVAEGTEVIPQATGRVSGLNIALGAYMPGVGPLVQIPISNMGFIERPNMRWLKDALLPFGAQKIDDMGSIVSTMVAPTWLKKAMVAIQKPNAGDERLYNNTVIDVYKSLLLSGRYDKNDKESSAAALERAKHIALNMWTIRTASAFIGPTGATFRFDVRDKDGKIWAFQALSSEYRKMLEKADWDHSVATQQFFARFGLDPSLLYPSKSRSLIRRSTTSAGAAFQANNPDLFKEYPVTAYYAQPDDPDDDFDYQAYLNQLAEKTRQGLTPDQWAQERNDFVGRIAYERARLIVAGRDDNVSEAWLRTFKTKLMEDYPGYNNNVIGLQLSADRDQTILEFTHWADSPELSATRPGRALAAYLAARSEVVRIGVQLGLSPTGFRNAKKARYLRDYLRQTGQAILMTYPEFGPMWEQVFSREIEEQNEVPDTMSLLGQEFDLSG